MGNSSFFVGRVMPFLIPKNQYFYNVKKTTRNRKYFQDRIAHILAFDKARIAHEGFLYTGGVTIIVPLLDENLHFFVFWGDQNIFPGLKIGGNVPLMEGNKSANFQPEP